MKRCRVVLLTLCNLLSASFLFAQSPDRNVNTDANAVVYLSPKNGDAFVPAKTTLIARLAKDISEVAAQSNVSFTVQGSNSGIHKGKIVLSDDNRTVIFKPDAPFVLSEFVTVTFSYENAERIAPINYSFQITEMTESERDKTLGEIRQNELEVNQGMALGQSEKNHEGILHNLHNDSLPCYYHVDSVNSPTPGNIFFSAVNLFSGAFSFIGIFNNSGSPAFYQNIPKGCENFKSLPDHTLSYFAQTSTPQSGVSIGYGQINRIDTNGNLLEVYQCGNGYTTDYHDFELLPDDHALLLSFDPEYVDMTKVITDTNAKTHAKVTGAIIQEIDKDKNVVFQWRSWDHCKITDATHESFTASSVDYVHINTAFIDTDGNIIASFRHMDEITKISRTDSTTIWRWGGKNNQFVFIGDTLQFSHQHNPTRITNGHITIWDNGNYRLKDTIIRGKDTIVNKPFSRAVEFDLDEINHIAKSVWEYRKVPLSPAGGDVQRLENGNTFMDFGFQTTPNMMEINPNGEKVFQLSLDYGAWCYRAYKFPEIVTASAKSSAPNAFTISGIYPNPAWDAATIDYAAFYGPVQITVTNILGHIVRSETNMSQEGNNQFNLNVHDLPDGTYYCRISQNGNAAMKMVVLQK